MPLDALLRPRSIAVVGASANEGLGRVLIESLAKLGFDGSIYPVNPKYSEVLGHRCYPSVLDVPEAPDTVALCLNYSRIMDYMDGVIERGSRSAVIYDAGFSERGEEGRLLQDRLSERCNESGLALAGPNCMGILNPHAKSTTYIYDISDASKLPGNVGLISQSGSICNAMLADLRRYGFSLIISSGNEANVTTADYIEYLIDDPNTSIIATFTESVRDPEQYVAALDRAAAAGKPVVVLKVGRSDRSRRAIMSHTGGLAGESRVFSQVLKAHRAIEVSDIDELAEVLAVCQGKRWPKGRRIGIVTGSGGLAELILDVSAPLKFELPPLSQAARSEVEALIGPITGDGNPLDAWGNGRFGPNLSHALRILDKSDDIDSVVFCIDRNDNQPMGRPDRAMDYVNILAAASRIGRKPHFLMCTRPGMMHQQQLEFLADLGIPVIGGTRQGLGAIDRLARSSAVPLPVRQTQLSSAGTTVAEMLGSSWRSCIHEHDSKRLLGSHGVSVTREALVNTLSQARQAGAKIGYPVALKAISDDVPHKSDLGLVAIGLADEPALDAAWAVLSANLAKMTSQPTLAGFLVQEMIADGLEVFVGISRDSNFGHIIAFGLGGVSMEVIGDISLRLLPLRVGDAENMIQETLASKLLIQFRGRPKMDVNALCALIYAVADYAYSDRKYLSEIDLNPIKILPEGQGCVVVDALIIPDKLQPLSL